MKQIKKIELAMKEHGGYISQTEIHEITGVKLETVKRSIRTMMNRGQLDAKRYRDRSSTRALYKYVKDYTNKEKKPKVTIDKSAFIKAALKRARNGAIESMRLV